MQRKNKQIKDLFICVTRVTKGRKKAAKVAANLLEIKPNELNEKSNCYLMMFNFTV
jgi:hypothetical protein